MRAALRSIDRYLVCQVIQVLLEPIVDDFVTRWQYAIDEHQPLPSPLELVTTATDNGIPFLTFHPLRAYLEGCARGNRVPDPARHRHHHRPRPCRDELHIRQTLPLPRPQGPRALPPELLLMRLPRRAVGVPLVGTLSGSPRPLGGRGAGGEGWWGVARGPVIPSGAEESLGKCLLQQTPRERCFDSASGFAQHDNPCSSFRSWRVGARRVRSRHTGARRNNHGRRR